MTFCFVLILPPEQGRRTDLLKRAVSGLPQDSGCSCTTIRSRHPNPISSQNIKSDSVHYEPSTQIIVSSGSSCHTADRLMESMVKDRRSPFPSYSLLAPPPPWVHVFSKSCANSSLRTQCAAVASVEVLSPTVCHQRLCRAEPSCNDTFIGFGSRWDTFNSVSIAWMNDFRDFNFAYLSKFGDKIYSLNILTRSSCIFNDALWLLIMSLSLTWNFVIAVVLLPSW